MAELIDRDALKDAIHDLRYGDVLNCRFNAEDVYRAIADAPTVAIGDRWAVIKWNPDLDKFARDVAYRGFNEFFFMGKNIHDWAEIILEYRAMTEWVSVEDRLPDKYGPYLVVLNTKAVNFKMAVYVWTGDGNGDFWRGAEAGSRITGVTHWRPLPGLPEEVKENGQT